MNEENQQALAIQEAPRVESTAPNIIQVTPAQARIESVAAVMDSAYRNASTLKLSSEEANALSEDFPDEAFRLGAGGDPTLLYIEHAYLRQRLNKVLGVGAAVPIRRREWAEDFTYWKDGKNNPGVRVYVDLALLVRGCLVGEAIGDAVYYPNNAKTNYSDALESAKSNAFRRCCKEFGVGLQAWMKGWCEGWMTRQKAGKPSGGYQQATQAIKTPPRATEEVKKATVAEVLPPKEATAATRQWMLDNLKQFSPEDLIFYAEHKKWILPNAEGLQDIPLNFVPTTKDGLNELIRDIERFFGARQPAGGDDELPQDIADAVITLPRKGMKRKDYMAGQPDTIGALYYAVKGGDEAARTRLFGVAENWTVGEWEDAQGKKHPPNKEDIQSRAALDAFLEWRETHGKND